MGRSNSIIYMCFGTVYLWEFVIEVLMKVMSQIGKHVVAVVQSFCLAIQPRNLEKRDGERST